MKIVYLMAGRGSRFKESGYAMPKSFIPVREKPMVSWATNSLSFVKNPEIIFICLKEHEETFGISEKLKKLYGQNITILFTDGITQGAASTALLAKDIINSSEELIISNADQHFISKQFEEEINGKEKNYSGLIPIFEATHPRWSFAKINDAG